jgi:hypothetical protein
MGNKIRYMYLRDAKREPIGCLAIKLHRKKGYLEYQVSTVNPIDRVDPITGRSLPFNRSMARHLAAGKMLEDALCVPMDSEVNMIQVSILVMKDLASLPLPTHRGDIPTRAIKAAKLWLNNRTQQDQKYDPRWLNKQTKPGEIQQ